MYGCVDWAVVRGPSTHYAGFGPWLRCPCSIFPYVQAHGTDKVNFDLEGSFKWRPVASLEDFGVPVGLIQGRFRVQLGGSWEPSSGHLGRLEVGLQAR